MTTINEGDTLYLDCDASNSSNSRPSVKWLSPEGVVVSDNMTLEIMNIQRSAAGLYTCVATHPIHRATMNSTVNVTVKCECRDVYKIIFACTKKVCEGRIRKKCV